eukprot:TRINITY_DN3257_c0_g1_i1.p3 TRINITY_DN3257_c0_g1~~TRINITY_DN3257_c0_g1_i1.p3  ORF type:complete len:272 (-),score=19.17 TRINITY_DN3257_c0_g1_i1:1417-2232(-)
MGTENEQNNKNLSNYQPRPHLINKHCKHCLACQFKGVAQKKELDGTIEKAKWLNTIETAELYITRARQADAIQRMLGVQPGPWGVPHKIDGTSQIRARRSLSPLQVCVPLQYTNIKPQHSRITVYPAVVIIPKWSVKQDKNSLQQSSKCRRKVQISFPRNEERCNYENGGGVMNQSEIKLRKSPILSPGQFIHFTWLNFCKVASGMKRKLRPNKQMGDDVQEPVRKIASFSELMENKPYTASGDMIMCKIVDCERTQSNFSEDSVDTVLVM